MSAGAALLIKPDKNAILCDESAGPEEIWRQLPRTHVEISSLGRSRDLRTLEIEPTTYCRTSHDGDLARPSISYEEWESDDKPPKSHKRNLSVVVAELFLPAPQDANRVRIATKNGDEFDCRVENLYWEARRLGPVQSSRSVAAKRSELVKSLLTSERAQAALKARCVEVFTRPQEYTSTSAPYCVRLGIIVHKYATIEEAWNGVIHYLTLTYCKELGQPITVAAVLELLDCDTGSI